MCCICKQTENPRSEEFFNLKKNIYMSHKVMLVILDGRGMQDNPEISAIAKAKTPYYDSLLATYPNTTLVTHSEAV